MRTLVAFLAVVAASSLGGCAHQFLSQAQNECSSFGFTPGTNEHANCVQQQYAAGRARFQQGLLNAQQSIGSSSYGTTTGGAATGTGFLRNSYVSGMNRICVYDRMGSAYAVTIGAVEICPLTPP
jgi:hypothetical protein